MLMRALAALVLTSTALALVSRSHSSSHGPRQAQPDRRDVLQQILQKPQGIDPTFECAWRKLALEYAIQLQPFRDEDTMRQVHDALELDVRCHVPLTWDDQHEARRHARQTPPGAGRDADALYVDFDHGDDANDGTEAHPLQHLAEAVRRARLLLASSAASPSSPSSPSSASPSVQVILREGVHRLSETLQLGRQDSGLSIVNYPGEAPVVSGGMVIKPVWEPVNLAHLSHPRPASVGAATRRLNNPSTNCTWQTFAGVDAMWDNWPSPNVKNLSGTPNADHCATLCQQQRGGNGACFSWIWYDPAGNFGPLWDGQCFIRTDAVWVPTPQHDTFSGHCVVPPPPPNVFVADLSKAGTPLPPGVTTSDDFVLTLFSSGDGGKHTQRAFRARFPNANLETDLYPTGWASGGQRKAPKCNASAFDVTHTPLPDNYGPGMFSDYYFGAGGTCSRFKETEWLDGRTDVSYWCQPNGRVAGCTYLVQSPSSFLLNQATLPHAPYQTDVAGTGAVLHYWRQGHWFSMMTRIDSVVSDDITNSTELAWTYGAFQGAEGDHKGEDWYLEHVLEELDSPREFFFEEKSQRLFYFHNDTQGTPPPASWTWEVPLLTCLINISGTSELPAHNILLSGLTFTSAAASYMGPHGIPSGGDWGLSRMGAVLMAGVEQVTVENSTFTRLDGNAVFLSGYTRNVTIDSNEFVWLGENAVASWGFTQGADASDGMQPWFTTMTRNLCHEIGLYEKQVSCYFAATTASATVADNIMFNMPRAAVNFNDDMAGGSKLVRNLIWNTCRESQDHGPFNSWGRVPYLRPYDNGTQGTGMKSEYDELAFNFIVAGGGANGGSFDHDDGSSFYRIHHNFEVYGGHKSDFDGHGKRSYSNIHAYANVYGSRCLSIMNLPHAADDDFFAEGYRDNKCVLANSGDAYLALGVPCSADETLRNRILLGGNEVYAPNASVVVNCGKTFTFAAWSALGLDVGSTVHELPDSDTIVEWARQTLNIKST